MNGYAADPYAQVPSETPAVVTVQDGSAGWYGEGAAVEAAAPSAAPEQQGFSIPTTGQANGGGPMRQGRGGGARFNPMGRAKPAGGDTGVPMTAANAEKNELGYIIFAYNIGYQTDESQLHSLFTPYGTVAKINVIQDFNTGMNKGYAFVTMPNQAEAEAAVNTLNGSSFNGNTLQVRFKSPKGQGPPPGVLPVRGGRGGLRGRGGGGFRGMPRGAPRGGGFRGGRGMPRGGGMPRGRARGAYSAAPSAYDSYGYPGYDQYGYGDPNAAYAGYDYSQGAPQADPYAAAGYGAAAGNGYASYGAAAWQ